MSKKVNLFISHAVTDAPVIEPFVSLIESGIGVDPNEIFCSSIKGQGIRPGTEFKESIRENLDDATTVIALISENYYNSPFCMCEIGGTWIQSKDFIPILIPPIRYCDMKAVLEGIQAIKIEKHEDLDELRDEIAERLGIKPLPTPRWNRKRDEFLKNLTKQLKKIPQSPVVQREQFEKSEKELQEYIEALSLEEDENTKLKEKISKLKKAKNAEQVAAIEREDMEEIDVFEELINDVKNKLSTLESVTVEALFVGNLGEDYYPERETSYYSWDDARRAKEYKEVELNYEENGIHINGNHPKVEKALNSISKLANWLENASNEFIEWYMGEHDDYKPDLSDRSFWDRHFL